MKNIRKITTKKDKKRNERRNQIIVGILLVGLMFLSTLGYAFSPKSEDGDRKRVVYKGFEFTSQGDYWVSEINGKYYFFSYNPYEIEQMNINLKGIDNYYNKPLYVYPDESNDAILEIIRNFSPQFRKDYIVQRTQAACINQNDCIDNSLPIKDCSENFIIVKEANETKITQAGNCVYIEGKQEDLIKLADEFLFNVLGVRE